VATALRSGKILYNYGIRRLTDREETELQRARTFRFAEYREEQARLEKQVAEVLAPDTFAGEQYIINHKKNWSDHPLIQAAVTVIKKQDLPFDWELLYSPFHLYTRMRKKNQISLLQSLIRYIKIGFNVEFERLLEFRNKQLLVIEEKNEIIKEKQEELKMEQKVYEHVCHVLEDPS
jgi:phosphopantothenoylcysteine synthetase/decarboxylase